MADEQDLEDIKLVGNCVRVLDYRAAMGDTGYRPGKAIVETSGGEEIGKIQLSRVAALCRAGSLVLREAGDRYQLYDHWEPLIGPRLSSDMVIGKIEKVSGVGAIYWIEESAVGTYMGIVFSDGKINAHNQGEVESLLLLASLEGQLEDMWEMSSEHRTIVGRDPSQIHDCPCCECNTLKPSFKFCPNCGVRFT